MSTTVLKGGRIVDQTGERSGDVLVDGSTGLIAEVGPDLNGDQVLDARDCIVAPGLVDLHAHLREPGHEAAETVETATRAAALGGFTAVLAMATTEPCIDSGPLVADLLQRAVGASCEVLVSGALSVGMAGSALTPMAEMADLGVGVFADAGRGIQDAGFMRRALEYASSASPAGGRPVVVAQHCVLEALAAGSVMHEGAVSTRLGLPGQPAEAEELVVMRDIALARLTGVHIHFQQLSTAGSVAMVRAAKAGGVSVSAEVTTHHLVLTDEACEGYDAAFKVVPPLRTATDVAALRAGLEDGTIDAIVSGHAPHTPDAKERAFDEAPPGVVGLETCLAVALSELGLPIVDVLGLMSWRPAVIAGVADRHGGPIEVGRPANLTVVDPAKQWTVDPSTFASKATNTPFAGRTLTGKVRHTMYQGVPTVIEGNVTR